MKKSWKILVLLPLISSCSFNISLNFGSSSGTSNSISSGENSNNSSSVISSETPSSSFTLPSENISSSSSTSSSISSSINSSLIEEAGATSFLDAQERTKNHQVSGTKVECKDISHLPPSNRDLPKEDGKYVRVSDANYEYNEDGSFKSYLINRLDGTYKRIYYGGAYVTLDEVAAYLLAFGEVPPNNHYATGKKALSVEEWGVNGRVNYGYFSGNGKYLYEPKLPNASTNYYIETDFGAEAFKFDQGDGVVENVKVYNDGNYIVRGICRFVFTNIAKEKDISKRHVFYTYNHYNDFQEYLNYEGGFGERFGCMSGGNSYKGTTYPITQYPEVSYKSLSDLSR